MKNVLLISGSNRKGNTEYLLTKLNEQLKSSELVLLRNKNINFCRGCLACHTINACVLKDDIQPLINKIIAADILVFGIPNYFDNVSGLFKNFIDRLHPLYKSGQLENKKVLFIYVGGGKEEGTLQCLHSSVAGLVKYLKLDIVKEYAFKALTANDLEEKQTDVKEIIKTIEKVQNEDRKI